MTTQNIEKIGTLFPNCITETVDENGRLKKAINFDILKQMLSGNVVEGNEAYQFTWVGKKAAIVEANKPIRKTLRPCKADSVNWDTTENLYIEGDNLEVLKLLQESYLGAIKMIYIDPPYNTGDDFIYRDDFKQSVEDYEEELGVRNDDGERMFKNTDSNGRFHSDWCSMIYSRLLLARNLLSDDGVIFISIDDNEVENLKKICNEIFGEENFVTTLHVEMSATQGMKVKAAQNGNIVKNAEYILIYSKDGHKNIAKTVLYDFRPEYDEHYSKFLTSDLQLFNLKEVFAKLYPNIKISNLSSMYTTCKEFREFVFQNADKICADDKISGYNVEQYKPGKVHKVQSDEKDYYIYNNGNKIRQLLLLKNSFGQCDDFNKNFGLRKIRGDWWKDFYKDMGNVSKEGNMVYANGKKPVRLIQQLCKMCLEDGDIVLDFFSGSATTAHAVMEINKLDNRNCKYILVQLPDIIDYDDKENVKNYAADNLLTICDIGKERIRRAGKKIKEDDPLITHNLDIGFRVFKLDESNMTDVYYSADEYSQGMLTMLESNVKADRTDLDLLFGCLLEWGLPLSLPYTSEIIEGCTVHTYNDGDLIACFDENIPDSVIKTIAKRQPLRAVFRDSSFADSPSKINVGEVFKLLAPETRVKVI